MSNSRSFFDGRRSHENQSPLMRSSSNSRQYHSTPTSNRSSRTYQPGMGLHQDFDLLNNSNDSDLNDSGGELPNSNHGARVEEHSAYSFTTPPNTHTPTQVYTGNGVSSHINRGSHRDAGPDVTILLQQQQGMLSQILKKQEEIEQKQSDFQDKLLELESKMKSPSVSSSPVTDSVRKRKRVVSKELSKKVSMLHDASEMKFNPEQSYQHNVKVRDFIIEQIFSHPENKYGKETVQVSVKRCYESVRRNFLEAQEGKEDFVQDQSKRRKYRSRRQRKFDKRSSVVTAKEREKYWDFLSYLYMTEESDDSNTIIEHKLQWRSKKLDEYIELLDKRLGERVQKEYVGIVAKKVRTCGQPSTSKPPIDAPSWAVRKNPEGHETAIMALST